MTPLAVVTIVGDGGGGAGGGIQWIMEAQLYNDKYIGTVTDA